MPIYDVVCKKCGEAEEIRLPYFDSPIPACTKEHSAMGGAKILCTGEREKTVSAPAAFVFDGHGTYDRGWTSK